MNKTKRTLDIITITVMGILTFGLQIPFLGFFQDDWNFVFYSSARGSQGLFEFLLLDGRPGATWVYRLGFALFGYKPALWQFFSLLLRILTTITFWSILNKLWPTRRYGNLIISIFFLAYPFFTLQPLSVAYAPHFAAYFLYSLSILLMIKASEQPGKYLLYSIPAVLFTFIHLFTVEYFIGLELMRPFILWFIISSDKKKTWKEVFRRVFTAWLPYLLTFIFFTGWRSFLSTALGARNNPIALLSDSGHIFSLIASNLAADMVTMLFSAWSKLIDPKMFVVGPIRNFYFLTASILGGVCFHFLSRNSNKDDQGNTETKSLFIAGVLIIATGMISSYAIGYIIHQKIAPWNSRFALPALLGLAMISFGFIEFIISSQRIRFGVLAILVGLLVGFHNNNTLVFKSAWEKQSRLYEQLIWRAPSIEPNTAIIASEEILGYMGDYPTSYGINTIYETKQTRNVPFWFFALSENFNFSADQVINADRLDAQRASVTFSGNSRDAIFISYEPENRQCLWVLRPEDSVYKYLSTEMKKAVEISNYENIHPEGTEHNLFKVIVNDNQNNWCYYYQKADLARQIEDWGKVVTLWNEAKNKGFQPDAGFEYIPFIEAYAHLGNWKEALLLTKSANTINKGMYHILCPTWEKLAQETLISEQKNTTVNNAYALLRCSP